METGKSKIFAQFIANLFGGAAFTLLAIIITISKICWDCPSYSIVILVMVSILGIAITEVTSKRYRGNFYLITPAIFIILAMLFLFYIGVEDWTFIGVLSLGAIIYSIIPAVLFSVAINWRKFSRKKQ